MKQSKYKGRADKHNRYSQNEAIAMVAELSSERVEAAHRRFDELLKQFTKSPRELDLLPQTLQELSNTVEELWVATEQVRQQNDQLVATRTLLEQERHHYQELFEFAPDGYLVTDMLGVIRETNSNAAKLLHMRRDFLIGKPIIVCVPDSEHVGFRRLLARLQREESISNWETKIQLRDGSSFPVAMTIIGDPQHLKQLSVAASTTVGGSEMVISVADTGMGIDPEAMPHIFRPFFTTKKKRGTGLGLSVCDRIMRAHGGNINVESSLGNGTTFFLRFPLMEDQRDGHS